MKRARPPLDLTAPAPEGTLLTTSEVARLLRVHPKHVYRLLHKGLPARRVGGEWRFDGEEVLAWSGQRQPRASASSMSEAALLPAGMSAMPPLVAANGDIAVERLLARVADREGPCLGFVPSDRALGVARLGRGEVLAAGYHGAAIPSSLASERLVFVHLVERQVGLATRNKLELSSLRQLARMTLASRPPTAGVRTLFDAELAKHGIDSQALHSDAQLFSSHCDVVCAVARGAAEVGLASHAWAQRAGLAFQLLGSEPYGLLLRASSLGDAQIVRLCEAAQSSAFRRDVEGCAGYDAARAGAIRVAPLAS